MVMSCAHSTVWTKLRRAGASAQVSSDCARREPGKCTQDRLHDGYIKRKGGPSLLWDYQGQVGGTRCLPLSLHRLLAPIDVGGEPSNFQHIPWPSHLNL